MKYIFGILTASFIFIGFSPRLIAEPSFSLNLAEARKVADVAFQCGAKNSWKLSVAIVNSEGNLVLFLRGDDTYTGSIEASIQKARSANSFQRPTSAFVEGIKQGRIGLVTVKDVVAIEGGVPIQKAGIHLGAIGVSGAKSTDDEECAKLAASSFQP